MNSTTVTVLVVLFAVACDGYGDVNVSSANTVHQRDTAIPNATIGFAIPLELHSGHLPEGQHIDYSSNLPTSGPHRSSWANCGFYTQRLLDEGIVDTLEHGNIVVSYNLADRAEVTGLSDRSRQHGLVWKLRSGSTIWRDRRGTRCIHCLGGTHSMVGVISGEIIRFFRICAGDLGPERIPC